MSMSPGKRTRPPDVALYIYQEAFANFRMGYASALAWFLLVIIGAFTAVSFLTSKYWVYYEDTRS
jgi:multiple sugar transport system permease protein